MVGLRCQNVISTAARLLLSIKLELFLHRKGEELLRSLEKLFLDLFGEAVPGDLEKSSFDTRTANFFHNIGD